MKFEVCHAFELERLGLFMKDTKDVKITDVAHVKYSYNEVRIPVFTGTAVLRDDGFHILHSNKVTVKIDDSIKYIEVVHLSS